MRPRGDREHVHYHDHVGDYLSIPILLAAVPVAACLVGWLLDRKLGTFPLFTVLLLGVGFVAGARELWLTVKRSGTKNDNSQQP